MDKINHIVLKGIVRGLAGAGAKSRKLIQSSSGDERFGHWTVKRSLGERARLYFLAYAYLRDVSFRVVESRTELGTSDATAFLAGKIAKIAEQFTYKRISESDITKWLLAEPAAEKQAPRPKSKWTGSTQGPQEIPMPERQVTL